MNKRNNQVYIAQKLKFKISSACTNTVLSLQLLQPQAKLQWKRCANMSVGLSKAQAVAIGNKVYIGGGVTENVDDFNQVLQYDLSTDEWSRLPPHLIVAFAMAQFMEHLITVGGRIQNGRFTGKVYCFKENPKKWEEFLKPMPTARYHLSVATTQSAIVASGGSTGFKDDKAVPCDTVEVYSSETSQWHTADSLPVPCVGMISVTIADTWYQLGGGNDKGIPTVMYAPLTDLIQKATSLAPQSASPITALIQKATSLVPQSASPITTLIQKATSPAPQSASPITTLIQKATPPAPQSASPVSVWKTLPDTPLLGSAAASLSGNLLAVGGHDESSASEAVHIFFPPH